MANRKIFENLRFSNILILLDILRTSRENQQFHVRKIYSERARGYAETIACVTRIGMIKEVNGTFQLSVNWVVENENQQRAIVLNNLLKNKNRYGSDIVRFIQKFRVLDGDIVYFSPAQERSGESAVRNFLMEMSIVKHIIDSPKYLLAPEYFNLYAHARDRAGYMSPSTLASTLSAKSDIGLAAEKIIIAYEKDRIGMPYADKIEHVSQKNVAAGYDVTSFTLADSVKVIPRRIEVKAVSGESCRFYWSQNEVEVARALGFLYYLYLLPLDKYGKFDISGLKIIADPYNVVIKDGAEWVCETNVLTCYLKSTD